MREENAARNSVKAVILLSPVSDFEWFRNMNQVLHPGVYDEHEMTARNMKPEVGFYD